MLSILVHFPFFLAFTQYILYASAVPPPFSALFKNPTTRIAVYDDIPSSFQLVYSVSSCPNTVQFGEPEIDARQVAVLPLSSINEDGTLCTGPSPIQFVGEANIRREDNLLEDLNLAGMREALTNNPNAKQLIGTEGPASLLVGWHDGDRTCNAKVYPRDTIYFILNEDNGKTISLKKPTQRDVVKIPPRMRSLLIVTPTSNICLLIDPSSNANDDVTITVVPDDGSPPTTTAATPGGTSSPPASSPPPAQSPMTSTAAPAVPAPASSPSPAALDSAVASPSVVPAAPSPGTSQGTNDSGVGTPTASPVVPVSSTPDGPITSIAPSASPAGPITSIAPSASPPGVGAVVPEETPGVGVVEVVPSDEGGIVVENTSPPDTDESACFPGSATVTLEDGGEKRMEELEVGDRVVTDTGLSDVILFTHREDKSHNTFIRVSVGDGDSLMVSPGHYVFSNERRLKAAGSLRRGDLLSKRNGEQAVITSVEVVSGVGLFNPQTECGSIVVNGFVTSTYTRAVDPSFAHSVLMVPVRWIYGMSPRMASVMSSLLKHGSPLLASLLPKGALVVA